MPLGILLILGLADQPDVLPLWLKVGRVQAPGPQDLRGAAPRHPLLGPELAPSSIPV